MGILYAAMGFLVIPAVLALFHRLTRDPGVSSQPDFVPASGLADEADRWLRRQR